MAFLKKRNCARSTINQVGGIDASALSVTVADASSFPTSGDFLATLWNSNSFPNPCDDPNTEIVKVTGVSGNIFTIERGQENTVGKAHSNGSAIAMLITAIGLLGLEKWGFFGSMAVYILYIIFSLYVGNIFGLLVGIFLFFFHPCPKSNCFNLSSPRTGILLPKGGFVSRMVNLPKPIFCLEA